MSHFIPLDTANETVIRLLLAKDNIDTDGSIWEMKSMLSKWMRGFFKIKIYSVKRRILWLYHIYNKTKQKKNELFSIIILLFYATKDIMKLLYAVDSIITLEICSNWLIIYCWVNFFPMISSVVCYIWFHVHLAFTIRLHSIM